MALTQEDYDATFTKEQDYAIKTTITDMRWTGFDASDPETPSTFPARQLLLLRLSKQQTPWPRRLGGNG
jgi:hypothetical protein